MKGLHFPRWASGEPGRVGALGAHLHWAWLVVPAFAAGVVVWTATAAQGVGTSPDSAAYVSAARSLLADGVLIRFDGTPLVEQPPLYPIALAAAAALSGADPIAAARGFQVAAAGVLALVMMALCARYVSRSPSLLAATALVSVLGAPLLDVAVMAWTETLFVALIGAALYCGLALLREPSSIRWLIWLALFAGASAVTRYAGVFVVAWAVLVTLVASWHKLSHAAGRAIAIAAIALIPLAAWALRNVSIGAAPLGPREPADETLSRSTDSVLQALIGWVTPDRFDVQTIAVAALLGAVVFAVWVYRAGSATVSPPGMSGAQWTMLVALPVGYLIFMVVLSLRAAFDPLSNRLLVPAFPALWLVLMQCAAVAGSAVSSHARGALVGLLLAAVVGWTATAVASDGARMLMIARTDGRGFSSAAWKSSALVAQVIAIRHRCALMSNNPEALYLLSGLAARSAPARTPYRSSQRLNEIDRWPPEEPTCLVWFSSVKRGYLHELSELQARAPTAELERAADGVRLGVPADRFASQALVPSGREP